MASDVAKPLVSVIVPMYNVGMFALPCVNSLLGQTYSNIVLIILLILLKMPLDQTRDLRFCIRKTAVFLLLVTLVLKGATAIMSCMLMGTI